jgi:hypothetical protein
MRVAFRCASVRIAAQRTAEAATLTVRLRRFPTAGTCLRCTLSSNGTLEAIILNTARLQAGDN